MFTCLRCESTIEIDEDVEPDDIVSCPECQQHGTPIDGLFLAGSGAHPGGGITCCPGALGAAAALRQRIPRN